jgi:hypothetical protein
MYGQATQITGTVRADLHLVGSIGSGISKALINSRLQLVKNDNGVSNVNSETMMIKVTQRQ